MCGEKGVNEEIKISGLVRVTDRNRIKREGVSLT